MSKDIVIVPENIPAYVLNQNAAREMNAEATAGISGGFPPSIRIKNGKFRLVDGAGEETVLKASELQDGESLDMVILRAKAGLNKVWYAKPYDPNAEASAPDCFSLDGKAPDASVSDPQCGSCAGCAMNAWGSGRNQAGEPTKGKACSDNKILAVLYKGGVYQFKIPPASLANWRVFVKNLSARDVPLGAVIVYVAFDEDVSYSILTFRVGGFIPEQAVPKLMTYVSSPEVEEIILSAPTPPANKPGGGPVKQVAEKTVQPATSEADIFGGAAEAEAAKPETVATKEGEPTIKELKAQAKAAGVKGFSKMDRDELNDAIYEATEGADPVEPAKGVEVLPPETGSDVPSDAELIANLGL